jgi:hypothetical protein
VNYFTKVTTEEEYIEQFFCQLVVSSLRSVQETFNEADMEFTKPPVSKNQVIFFLCSSLPVATRVVFRNPHP